MATWIIAILVGLAGGLMWGFAIGRSNNATAKRATEAETKLRQAQADLDVYRDQVTQHFSDTADLFNTMTSDYRALYKHLATGAQSLCSDQVAKLTNVVTEGHLPGEESTTPSATPKEDQAQKGQILEPGIEAELQHPVEETEVALQTAELAEPAHEHGDVAAVEAKAETQEVGKDGSPRMVH